MIDNIEVRMMETIIKNKWNDILKNVQNQHRLSDISYKTWLRPIAIDRYIEGYLFLHISDIQMIGEEYIRKKYTEPLKKAVKEELGVECEIIWAKPCEESQFAFEKFIVSSCNSDAYVITNAIIKNFYRGNSVVFIRGHKDSGKTHLLKAMKLYAYKHQINKNVYYVSGETLFSELLWDIQNGTKKYLSNYEEVYDVLLVDDIDYIPKSKIIQDEILRLLVLIKERDGQIVITSKRTLYEMENLTEELRCFLMDSERVEIASVSIK